MGWFSTIDLPLDIVVNQIADVFGVILFRSVPSSLALAASITDPGFIGARETLLVPSGLAA